MLRISLICVSTRFYANLSSESKGQDIVGVRGSFKVTRYCANLKTVL